MSRQTTLFSKTKPPIRLPQKTLKGRVFDALKERQQTDAELCQTLRKSANSVRPRRIELEREGRIVAVGKRKSKSGRDCTVWGVARTSEGSD